MSSSRPTRVAMYLRVSTKDKGQDVSLQRDEIMAYCQRQGFQDITEYAEQESATKTRPVFDSLMRKVQANKIDIVLVWKLDRMARSMREAILILMELERVKVRFISITQGIDTDVNSPMHKLTMNILMAFAEFEREMIRERVISGIASAQRRGVKFGRKRKTVDDIGYGLLDMAARGKISVNRATVELNAMGVKMSRQTVTRRVDDIREKLRQGRLENEKRVELVLPEKSAAGFTGIASDARYFDEREEEEEEEGEETT